MRARPQSWFSDLLEAATRVFIAKGYRQAQMSDIARAMGVSQGTLYNYVEGKEALFLLVCQRAFSAKPIAPPDEPPVPSPSFPAMVQRVRELMLSIARLDAFHAALRTKSPGDARGELEGVLRELYSIIELYRRGFDLVERSALDVPELAQILFVEGRRETVAGLTRYLTSRIESGYFRRVPDPPTAARFIVESITWFARHRHNTPDSQMIGDHDALETTIHFLVSALIAPERPETGLPRKRSRSLQKRRSGNWSRVPNSSS